MGGRSGCIRRLWGGLCLLVGAGLVSPALAQPQAVIEADTTRLTLGDPLLLTLTLRYAADEKPLPLDLTPLEAFGAERLDAGLPQDEDGAIVERRRYRLRVFDPDFAGVPAMQVAFVAAGGDTLYRSTRPVDVEMVRVRPDEDGDLRDVKPPLRLPGGVPLWLAIAAALLLVAGLVGVWLYARRRRPPPVAAPPPPVDFVAEFAAIAAAGLVEEGRLKEYYTRLSDTLRRFIEVHFAIEALERTSGEIDQLLQGIGVEAETRARVASFFAEADLVKFARFSPEKGQARQAAEAGGGLVADCLAARAAAEKAAAEKAAAEKAAAEEKPGG